MADYQFEFDDTKVGDARYFRKDYETLQDALKLLEAKLREWNQVAMAHGALKPPYKQEVEVLRDMNRMG